MLAFINDHSLEEHIDGGKALRLFLVAWQELNEANFDRQSYRDSHYFVSAPFKRRLADIRLPSDVKALVLLLLFREAHFPCWRAVRLSSTEDIYSTSDPRRIYVDQTPCEAAERKLSDTGRAVVLLSAEGSSYTGKPELCIVRDSDQTEARVLVASTIEQLRHIIASQAGHYNPQSARAPTDAQTILMRNQERFEFTGKRENYGNGRKVFRDRNTGWLYYVDRAHGTGTAHLEVFSSVDKHEGTADINTAVLDTSKARAERQLNF